MIWPPSVSLTYPELLQTIGTLTGVVGAACAAYATFLARGVHGTVRDIHETVKAGQQRQENR